MEEPLRWMKIQGPVRDRLKEAASIIESTEGRDKVALVLGCPVFQMA